MTWFWVLLGKYFDKRNGVNREKPSSGIHWTKLDKPISQMNESQRKELAAKIALGFLTKLGKRE